MNEHMSQAKTDGRPGVTHNSEAAHACKNVSYFATLSYSAVIKVVELERNWDRRMEQMYGEQFRRFPDVPRTAQH